MNAPRPLPLAVLLLSLLSLAACGNKGDLVRPPPIDAETGTEAEPADGDDDGSEAPPPEDDIGDDGTAPSVDMLPPPDADDSEDDGGSSADGDGG